MTRRHSAARNALPQRRIQGVQGIGPQHHPHSALTAIMAATWPWPAICLQRHDQGKEPRLFGIADPPTALRDPRCFPARLYLTRYGYRACRFSHMPELAVVQLRSAVRRKPVKEMDRCFSAPVPDCFPRPRFFGVALMSQASKSLTSGKRWCRSKSGPAAAKRGSSV